MGDVVMDVSQIKERYQDACIQQRGKRHGSSSRRRLTNSTVRMGSFGLRGPSKGTPFRTRTQGLGLRPLRTSSEMTLPVVLQLFAAISLAACSTSSSISSVVRMP